MTKKAQIMLFVMLLVVVVLGVAAYTGGFAFLTDAVELAAHAVTSGDSI